MSDVKRYDMSIYYCGDGSSEIDENEHPEGKFVLASDYAALREQCRWAMVLAETMLHNKFDPEDRLLYERVQAWLAANREEKA